LNHSWKLHTIQDFIARGEAELKTGPFGTQLHASDYVKSGTPVINVRNIGFGDIKEEKLEFVSDETVNRLSSQLLSPNDIVFGRKGAVERHAFIKEKTAGWFQGSDCLRLRLKSPSADPRFVSYYLLTEDHQQWMKNQCSHAATMASLNQDIISRIPLHLPPLPTQRKIAAILSAYDDLIENNTRRIKILEEMAQALYREWFVHFRFPGHEKARMVDSPLGRIPVGWEAITVRDVSDYINRGISPKYDDKSGNIVINQKCIRDRRLNLEPFRRHLNKVPKDKLIRPGDILINSTGVGTLGRVAQIYEEIPNCTVDSHVSIVRPGNKVTIDYFGLSLINQQDQFEHLGTGSTGQAELNRDSIASMDFLLPPKSLQLQFTSIVEPMRKSMTVMLNRNTNLRRTRDLLLPKLISGNLNVENMDIKIGNLNS